MIYGFQIRGARAVALWTEEELAQKAAVAVETITTMESVNGVLPETDELQRIVSVFDEVEIWFEDRGVWWPGGGVRLRAGYAPGESL